MNSNFGLDVKYKNLLLFTLSLYKINIQQNLNNTKY